MNISKTMLAQPTILIVDDSPLFRASLVDILVSRFADLKTIEVDREQDVYSCVDAKLPDLIFMDVSFSSPGFTTNNGIELTRKIVNYHPDVPVVIMTSYDSDEYRDAALESGARHFICKDIVSEALLALVNTLLYG